MPGELCFRKIPDAPDCKASDDSAALMPAVTIRILPANPAARAAAMRRAAVIVAEVEVQQNDVDRRARRISSASATVAAMRCEVEFRLGRQQPAHALAKQYVIVNQQESDAFHVPL